MNKLINVMFERFQYRLVGAPIWHFYVKMQDGRAAMQMIQEMCNFHAT